MNASIYIPVLCLVISLIVGMVGSYYGAQIGVKVALAETKVRLDFIDREMTSYSNDIGRLNTEMTLIKYDWWSIDADVERVCKKSDIDRVPRRHRDDGQH